MNDLNLQNAEFFGIRNQLDVLCEELAELTQAASKYKRMLNEDPTLRKSESEIRENLIEELADVSIMTDQIRHLLKIPSKRIIEKRSEKIWEVAKKIEEIKAENFEYLI